MRPTLIVLAALVLAPAAAFCGSAKATEFGVYVGAGCAGRDRIPAFARFAGHPVERTVDALSQLDWAALDSSIDYIVGCWKGSGLKLTLSVPMMPRQGGGTLAEGAAGLHDGVFRHVARTLVADGYASATVRIGWEFNGDWMPWAAAGDPDGFIAYYRRIVAVMRGVEGAHLSFEWCPNHRRHAMDPPRAYPGDDVVDVIGMDVYDEIWNPIHVDPAERWSWYRDQPFGLRWHSDFAARHGKPIAYSEWGTGLRRDGHGAGDDPVFIAGMADWFVQADPLYQSYWDDDSPDFNTKLSTGQYPRAASAFVEKLGVEKLGVEKLGHDP